MERGRRRGEEYIRRGKRKGMESGTGKSWKGQEELNVIVNMKIMDRATGRK